MEVYERILHYDETLAWHEQLADSSAHSPTQSAVLDDVLRKTREGGYTRWILYDYAGVELARGGRDSAILLNWRHGRAEKTRLALR